ncbi:MAG: ATP-binding cassette domain-containing protein [Candidatus Omnitrophica bacterium]|nr:ATP-binding cassette domain-containing protein [Candidatus Omnitrophota bacterium]
MNSMLEVKNLSKIYRTGREHVIVLHNVSLRIEEGDYVSIVGPSGAGKSTLLHAIGGLEPPTGGEVLWKGKDVYRLRQKQRARWRRRSVGYVFQFYHLIDELRVRENVALPRFLKHRKSSFKKAAKLLEYLDILPRQRFFPFQLSGGEKQKVAFARALVNEPELILCDEPTGNLDRESREKITALLDRLNRELGKTVILVTHNHELAQKAARILYLEEGRIREKGDQ